MPDFVRMTFTSLCVSVAEKTHTGRAQVDRILKANGNLTIQTLQRAAALFGRELRLDLV